MGHLGELFSFPDYLPYIYVLLLVWFSPAILSSIRGKVSAKNLEEFEKNYISSPSRPEMATVYQA